MYSRPTQFTSLSIGELSGDLLIFMAAFYVPKPESQVLRAHQRQGNGNTLFVRFRSPAILDFQEKTPKQPQQNNNKSPIQNWTGPRVAQETDLMISVEYAITLDHEKVIIVQYKA